MAVMFKCLNCSIIVQAIVVFPDLVPVPAIRRRFGIIIIILKKQKTITPKAFYVEYCRVDTPNLGVSTFALRLKKFFIHLFLLACASYSLVSPIIRSTIF